MPAPTNPYHATELQASDNDESLASHEFNPFIERMFYMQRIALGFIFATLGSYALMQFAPPLPWVVYRALEVSTAGALCAFWYFVFRAATRNHNWFFGLGHVAISLFLTPWLLVGLILLPVLIRGDAERLARPVDENHETQ